MKTWRYLGLSLLIALVSWGAAQEFLVAAKPTLLYSQRTGARFGGTNESGSLLWVSSGRSATIHTFGDGGKVGYNPDEASSVCPWIFMKDDQAVFTGTHYKRMYSLGGKKISKDYGYYRAASPDGTRVFASKSDRADSVILSSLDASGAEVWTVKMPGRDVVRASYHPDGTQVAAAVTSSYGDHYVIVLDAASGKVIWREERAQRPNQVAFSPDGKSLAVVWSHARDDCRVELFDTRRYKKKRVLVEGLRIYSLGGLRWSPDGKTVALYVSFPEHTVHLVRAKDGKRLAQLTGELLYFERDFTSDGKALLTVRYEGTKADRTTVGTLRRAKDGKKLRELRLKGYTNVGMSPDGRVLFDSGSYEPRPEVTVLVGRKKHVLKGTAYESFTDPSGEHLITTHGGEFRVWKL